MVGEDFAEWPGRVGDPVGLEQLDYERWQRHNAPAGLGFGERLRGHRAGDLDCDPHDLDHTGVEVDGVPAEADTLAPAQSGSAGEGHECTITFGDGR